MIACDWKSSEECCRIVSRNSRCVDTAKAARRNTLAIHNAEIERWLTIRTRAASRVRIQIRNRANRVRTQTRSPANRHKILAKAVRRSKTEQTARLGGPIFLPEGRSSASGCRSTYTSNLWRHGIPLNPGKGSVAWSRQDSCRRTTLNVTTF